MRILIFFIMLLVTVTGVNARQLMKDPTRPANKVVVENPEAVDSEAGSSGANPSGFPNAKLSAIVVTEPAKYAIINNEVVYEGQQWRNVLLSEVKAYSVVLKLNDLEKEITINKTDFITESNYDH